MPNELSISGHTDSLSYAGGTVGYSNWELSSDRANASRRELIAGGLDASRLLRISGVADNVPMPDLNRDDPRNRRIELLILYQETAEGIRYPTTVDSPLAETGVASQSTDGGQDPSKETLIAAGQRDSGVI